MTPVRPIVVASACLGDATVRYDGQAIRDPFFARLAGHVRMQPVCPEVEIGLGVPRDPILLEGRGEGRRLVQPSTGRDLTARMGRFSSGFLSGLGSVDGFILKSRSPSCGIRDVKAVDPKSGQPLSRRESGFFAAAVLERFPHVAVEDEARLTNLAIREHFLTRIFAGAELRRVRRAADLVRFHARFKLLLMACSEKDLRVLGRMVANHERLPVSALISKYADHFRAALARPSRRTARVNALQHAMGYFSRELKSREKEHILRCMSDFKSGLVPLSVPVAVLRSWMARYPRPYLEDQAFFNPFPESLIDPADSGRGRLREGKS